MKRHKITKRALYERIAELEERLAVAEKRKGGGGKWKLPPKDGEGMGIF